MRHRQILGDPESLRRGFDLVVAAAPPRDPAVLDVLREAARAMAALSEAGVPVRPFRPASLRPEFPRVLGVAEPVIIGAYGFLPLGDGIELFVGAGRDVLAPEGAEPSVFVSLTPMDGRNLRLPTEAEANAGARPPVLEVAEFRLHESGDAMHQLQAFIIAIAGAEERGQRAVFSVTKPSNPGAKVP